jgi:hypothetical protein
MEKLEDIAELADGDEIIIVCSQSRDKGRLRYMTMHGYVTFVRPDGETGKSILSLRDMYMFPVGLDMDEADEPVEMIEIFRNYLKPSNWGPTEIQIAESKLASYKLYRMYREEKQD